MKFFHTWEDAERYARKHNLFFSISNDYRGLVGTKQEIRDFTISEKGMQWFHGNHTLTL